MNSPKIAAKRLNFFVPGNPVPKERPRFGNGKTYTPQATKDYKALVQTYANIAMAQQSYQMPDKNEPLLAVLTFYRSDRRGVDTDNLAKAVFDALNKLVFADDKMIMLTVIRLERGVTNEAAGVDIEIKPYFEELGIIDNLAW